MVKLNPVGKRECKKLELKDSLIWSGISQKITEIKLEI